MNCTTRNKSHFYTMYMYITIYRLASILSSNVSYPFSCFPIIFHFIHISIRNNQFIVTWTKFNSVTSIFLKKVAARFLQSNSCVLPFGINKVNTIQIQIQIQYTYLPIKMVIVWKFRFVNFVVTKYFFTGGKNFSFSDKQCSYV